MKKPIYIVVAVDKNFGIGYKGKLPWRLKKEIKYFKDLTTKTDQPATKNAVIMGRTTWESIPEKFRPLPERQNIVLTRNPDYVAKNAHTTSSLPDAIAVCENSPEIDKIFIIGGASLFDEAIQNSELSGIYLTQIHKDFPCDTHFPKIPEHFNQKQTLGSDQEDDVSYDYLLITP